MRTTLKQTLATMAALGALLIAGNACTDHDDLRNPAGTQLLALGEVNIAGAQTATADTRAAITEDPATGFFGIRKSSFVADDELTLTLSGGTATQVTATLDATTKLWTLPAKTYYATGTKLTATYTPGDQQPGGIKYKDDLIATIDPLQADGSKLDLTLSHANALIEVTPPTDLTGNNIAYTDLTVSATTGTSAGTQPETLLTAQEGTGSDPRHRTIAPAGSTMHSVSLKVNGMTYTAPINGTPTLEANKRYPIALTITGDVLKATVGTALNWGAGGTSNGKPVGYTYYISTPEELAQFAADVNAATSFEAAAKMVAIQTADIDLSQLKAAAGSYTYTATADNWVPIGTGSNDYTYFRGRYNGNGHTISNLTINQGNTGVVNLGLFGQAVAARITGIHLRNCTIKSTGKSSVNVGALVGHSYSSIVTLCSATGSIDVSGTTAYIGGMAGKADNAASSIASYFTRCSADVAVTSNTNGNICGFTGHTLNAYYAGCIASGKVHNKGTASNSGFSNRGNNYHAYHCITNSEIVNDKGGATSAFGDISYAKSCLATQMSYGVFGTVSSTNCNVALGTLTTGINPPYINANVAVADVYTKLTATNFSSSANYAPIKTLHWSKEDGYTFDVVENKWCTLDAWQNNGATALPTLNMAYEGSPEPIVANNKVYMVNGYYVTAPEGETTTYAWAASTGATAMTPDPCAAGASKGWHLPTMKEFEAMAGWNVTNPWSESVINTATALNSDPAAFYAAFPKDGGIYWSSVVYNANNVNTLGMKTDGQLLYATNYKTTKACRVRCVQKQILTR